MQNSEKLLTGTSKNFQNDKSEVWFSKAHHSCFLSALKVHGAGTPTTTAAE